MPNKKIQGSLSGIVEKMNEAYHGLIGEGFSPGVGRRVVPVMIDDVMSGWKILLLNSPLLALNLLLYTEAFQMYSSC